MQDSAHDKFVSFIDKLIVKLGIERVFTCYAKKTLIISEEAMDKEISLRAWLAVEILCTWKWSGGSAVASFLPLLIAYAESSNSSSKEILLDSIFSILLDGALMHGVTGHSFFTTWEISSTEVEHIEEPFLRALVSYILALFNDGIWKTGKARILFKLLTNKLCIGETINSSCLKILPRVISALVHPLFESESVGTGSDAHHDSAGENYIQATMTGWLEKALLFPPMFMWETGQGKYFWIIRFFPILLRQELRSCASTIVLFSVDVTFFILFFFNIFLSSSNCLSMVCVLSHVILKFSLWFSVEMEDWLQLVISCYSFNATAGIQTLKHGRIISHGEKKLLLDLFRKQRPGVGISDTDNRKPEVQLLLSNLIVISVGYCSEEFDLEDWEYVLSRLRRWIQSVVVILEDVAESIDDSVLNNSTSDNMDSNLEKLRQIVTISDPFPIDVAKNALLAFSLIRGPFGFKQLDDETNANPRAKETCDHNNDRIFEGILRLFFCTGISEAAAGSLCHEASSIISSSRFEHLFFWELIASHIVKSSALARDRAVKSVEFWGLSIGPVSSLYTMLFSSKPIPLLQHAAYVMLSNEPVSNVAVIKDGTKLDSNPSSEELSQPADLSTEASSLLRDEISWRIEKLPYEFLELDLMAHERVLFSNLCVIVS